MTNAAGEPVHLSFPVRLGSDGRLAVDVEDTPEHVLSQLRTVASFPVGVRADRPAFGISWPEFANAPIDTATIVTQLEAQVPDADLTASEYADVADAAIRHIRLEVAS